MRQRIILLIATIMISFSVVSCGPGESADEGYGQSDSATDIGDSGGGDSGGGGNSGVDTVPPYVISINPLDGSSNIPVNTTINVAFSEALDPNSINNSFIFIENGNNIAGTITSSGDTATFTPANNLSYNTAYAVIITQGLQDVAGNAMQTNYVISFTTENSGGGGGDTTPPHVISSMPINSAANVPVNTAITVTFSEPMDSNSINTSTFTVNRNGINIGGVISYSGATATFTPSSSLFYDTAYTIIITTGVKDIAGNFMTTNYTARFQTVYYNHHH